MVAEPSDETCDIDVAAETLTSIVARVRRSGRRATLTRAGQPVAAIVMLDDADAAIRQRRVRVAEAAREIGAALADVGLDEIDRRVKEAIDEVRGASERRGIGSSSMRT